MLKDEIKKHNPIAFKIITNAMLANKASHAFLFSAPQSYEISKEWKYLAQVLINKNFSEHAYRNLDTYPDLTIIEGQIQGIKKEQVLQALKKMQQSALEKNTPKILVITNIEFAQKQATNALLKFLEEPPRNTYVILTTNYLNQVLSTIQSRCQILRLKAWSKNNLQTALKTDFPDKYQLLAELVKNTQEAPEIAKLVTKYWKSLNQILLKSYDNKLLFFPEMHTLITIKNYHIIWQLLELFYNDLWKKQSQLTTFFAPTLINNYLDINFNYQKALKAINNFFISYQRNGNFELIKAAALVEIGACYG